MFCCRELRGVQHGSHVFRKCDVLFSRLERGSIAWKSCVWEFWCSVFKEQDRVALFEYMFLALSDRIPYTISPSSEDWFRHRRLPDWMQTWWMSSAGRNACEVNTTACSAFSCKGTEKETTFPISTVC